MGERRSREVKSLEVELLFSAESSLLVSTNFLGDCLTVPMAMFLNVRISREGTTLPRSTLCLEIANCLRRSCSSFDRLYCPSGVR